MLTRRRFLRNSAVSSAALACPPLVRSAFGQVSDAGKHPLRLAVIGSVYQYGSNLQTIADRFMVGFPYEGDWHMPDVQVVSAYVDQRARAAAARPSSYDRAITGTEGQRGNQEAEQTGDLSQSRAQQFGFHVYPNVQAALRCGGDRIAVDAVLAIFEQGGDHPYAINDKGQALVPSYDFFQQCTQVFEEEGHTVPYFNHSVLSFSFVQAQSMVKTAERLTFPLMAGSSMPVTWRLPDVDVPLGAQVQEAVMAGVNGFHGSAFDALEAMQAMLERRKGGETGVKAVQLLEGEDVWAAQKAGRWSTDLLRSALSRSDTPLGLTVLDGRTQDLAVPGILQQLVPNPVACCIEYIDGTRATLLMLDGAIEDFNISVRIAGEGLVSTQFFLPPDPNQGYSACLAGKIEQMYQVKSAPYSVQRTLLTTGILEAAMNSKHRLNQRVETPHLVISYQPPSESQYTRS